MNAAAPKYSHLAASHRVPGLQSQELGVRKLGRKRLRRFAALSAKSIASGNPNVIHDVRVASRRLQQVLDFLCPAPRLPVIRHARNRLRRFRQALGKLRDYDVFIASIDTRAKSTQFSHQKPVLTVLRQRLINHRVKLVKKSHSVIEDIDVPALCNNIQTILRNADAASKSGKAHPIDIHNALHGLWRDLASDISKSRREPRPAILHRVRIKAKRLRYLLEVVEELKLHDASAPLLALRRLQNQLGQWHDIEIQTVILLKLTSRKSVSSKISHHTDQLLSLLHDMHNTKTEAEREYIKMINHDEGWKQLQQWMTAYSKN